MPVDHAQLTQCFIAVFPSLTAETAPAASMDTMPDWDSVAGINLLTVIEEELGVRVIPEDFVLLTNYSQIHEYLGGLANGG